MARLGTFTVTERSEDRKETMQVKIVINVNQEGMFTTTLSEQDVKLITSYGVKLDRNWRSGSRLGYFESATKDGLYELVSNTLMECLSREVVSKEVILRYAISTSCSYAKTLDNQIIPNPGWVRDGDVDKDSWWMGGSVITHACNPNPAGIEFYVKPFEKTTYKYKSGDKRTEYEKVDYTDDQYYLMWLDSICSVSAPKHVNTKEMVYTEESAKFFVDLYKGICRLVERLDFLQDDSELNKFISSNQQLMLPG